MRMIAGHFYDARLIVMMKDRRRARFIGLLACLISVNTVLYLSCKQELPQNQEYFYCYRQRQRCLKVFKSAIDEVEFPCCRSFNTNEIAWYQWLRLSKFDPEFCLANMVTKGVQNRGKSACTYRIITSLYEVECDCEKHGRSTKRTEFSMPVIDPNAKYPLPSWRITGKLYTGRNLRLKVESEGNDEWNGTRLSGG